MDRQAEWIETSCPNCRHYMVAADEHGYYCYICGWYKNNGGDEYFPDKKLDPVINPCSGAFGDV
jgi:tRNA(Ile2) C34 agmatinyltransferase TiaS